MDKLFHVVDMNSSVSSDTLAGFWRDRLSNAPGDANVRERDLKLLQWLEYAETLVAGECHDLTRCFSSCKRGEEKV